LLAGLASAPVSNSFAVSHLVLPQPQENVKGRVLDAQGTPIAGATVRVKNSQEVTSTDAEGYFQLKTPSQGFLSISFLGYEPLQVPIDIKNPILATLQPSGESLDEVVVIGYGTQSRKETTGSLTSVKGTDVANLPVQSFDASLAGRSS